MRLDVAALAVGFGLCLAAAGAAAQTGDLQVTNAWARATPGKAENGAAYLTIVSPVADRVIAASTPAAQKAELHTMSMEGGVMKMRPLDKGLAIEPGKVTGADEYERFTFHDGAPTDKLRRLFAPDG